MDKAIHLHRHARHRMKWRHISEEEVRSVLKAPEKTQVTSRDRINAYKTIGQRYLKVTYADHEDYLLVITVVDKLD